MTINKPFLWVLMGCFNSFFSDFYLSGCICSSDTQGDYWARSESRSRHTPGRAIVGFPDKQAAAKRKSSFILGKSVFPE